MRIGAGPIGERSSHPVTLLLGAYRARTQSLKLLLLEAGKEDGKSHAGGSE